MAKLSVIERNKKRENLARRYDKKRAALRAIIRDMNVPAEERFQAVMKLAALPRNSARVRLHLRCELTGRGRGVYRKFKLSRIKLREMSNSGQIPGMVKSSW